MTVTAEIIDLTSRLAANEADQRAAIRADLAAKRATYHHMLGLAEDACDIVGRCIEYTDKLLALEPDNDFATVKEQVDALSELDRVMLDHYCTPLLQVGGDEPA